MYRAYFVWILGRKRGKRRTSMKAVGMEYPQIRLNSGVAAGIASGNCQNTMRHTFPPQALS